MTYVLRLGRLAAQVAPGGTGGSAGVDASTVTRVETTSETRRSAALHAESQRYLPLGVSSQFRRGVSDVPRFYTHANGPWHYDADGNKMLDYGLAFGPLILGSNHPAINKAVTEKVTQMYAIGAGHEDEVKLAKKLCEVIPGAENVLLSNTGSEAVQTAIKLARATTGRSKFVKFEGHYHGWFNNVLVSVHQPAEAMGPESGLLPTIPDAGGNVAAEHADVLTLPWNRLDLLSALLEERGHEIAAVITEPINANSGNIEPVEGFLQGLVSLCKTHGVVSIFDEVITGFRLALGGAREYFGVTPDLSTYAKALAGGFTLSAVVGAKHVFDCLRDGRTSHSGTCEFCDGCLPAAPSRPSSGGFTVIAHRPALTVSLVASGVVAAAPDVWCYATDNGQSINVAAALATITTLEAGAATGMYRRVRSISTATEILT
jgi:glutamate-1-semialdehyde 2,1-aminomutase